jgi:hypothetical protein
MATSKLSAAQQQILEKVKALSPEPYKAKQTENRTIRALERRGLVRYEVRGFRGYGGYSYVVHLRETP